MGSVYGSSGPLSVDSATDRPALSAFPIASMRDNVRAQRVLLDYLGVRHVTAAVGGSLGGMLALEWASTFPDYVSRVVVIADCAAHP